MALRPLAARSLSSQVLTFAPRPIPTPTQVIINLPPAAPTIQILVPTSGTTFDAGTASSIAVSGIGTSLASITGCTYSNNLGGSGTTVSTPNINFSIASLALTVGDNILTITCTDVFNQIGTDVLTITRSAASTSNPIAAARLPAGDASVPNSVWSVSGVEGGIPSDGWQNCTTTACRTLCPNVVAGVASLNIPTCVGGTVNSANITSAVNNAPDSQVVWLPAGNTTIGGMNFNNDFTELRGQGANLTVLKVNSLAPVSCHIGIYGQLVNACKNGTNVGSDSPENVATWTAGFAQGTTVITLSTVANLTVGRTIWLDQLDDPGFPTTADIYVIYDSGGENQTRASRGQLEGHQVTAINGLQVTISPGVMMPNVRSARTPGAWWPNSGTQLNYFGIRDLTLDNLGSTAPAYNVINATNTWVKGVRLINTATVSSDARLFALFNVVHGEVRDSYIYGMEATGLLNMYSYGPANVSLTKFENNVQHAGTNPLVTDSCSWGNVFAYNTVEGGGIGLEQASIIFHACGGMDLLEGNEFQNISFDNIHWPHFFMTMHRNHLDGNTRNTLPGESQSAVPMYAWQRFTNATGNVMGATNWTAYERDCGVNPCTNGGDHCQECIWELGFRGTNSLTNPFGDDARVKATLMRWGNWDSVTSTNDNGTNDLTGIRWVSAEVPSGITTYANTVPSAQTVPPSLYLSAKPAWFGSIAYPPIGPDVANGNVPTRTGGHVNKIPSKACFDATATDTANGYNGVTPPVKAWNAAGCGF